MTTGPRPLDGILVADFTRVLAGPFCTALLADPGARVIKIERPGAGDPARGFGPFKEGRYFVPGRSAGQGAMRCSCRSGAASRRPSLQRGSTPAAPQPNSGLRPGARSAAPHLGSRSSR
jgi:hypothetical protein